MNKMPIIQNFFGTPVRFFKTEFDMEMTPHYEGSSPKLVLEMGSRKMTPSTSKKDVAMGCRYNTPSGAKISIQTWAIPLPDFCKALNQNPFNITRMIKGNSDVFEGLYRTEKIADALGRMQPTFLMALEMCQMLVAKLHTSRLKDPQIKALVVGFQRYLTFTFYLINTRQLRPARWPKNGEAIDPRYLHSLSIPSGCEHKVLIQAIAKEEDFSENTSYRRAHKVRGSNIITAKGKPRRTRSDSGKHTMPEEYKKVIDTLIANPGKSANEIHRISKTRYSFPRVIYFMNEYKKELSNDK